MKAFRLVGLLCALLFCSSFAFAGPPIAVSDPQCDHSQNEIQLHTASFSFIVLDSSQKLVFCNATQNNFNSLNFTIVFPSSLNLAGIYCGGPDNGSGVPAAFDFCNVLDPLQNNPLLHTFDSAVDTPSAFYSNNPTCTFGCHNPTTPPTFGSLVELAFGTFSEEEFGFSGPNDNNCGAAGTGLVSGCRFTIDFNCPTNSIGCNPMPVGTAISFLGSTSNSSSVFPAPVPEPATIFLMTGVAVPAIFRRVRRNRRT